MELAGMQMLHRLNYEMEQGSEAVSAEFHMRRTCMPQKHAILLVSFSLRLDSFTLRLFPKESLKHLERKMKLCLAYLGGKANPKFDIYIVAGSKNGVNRKKGKWKYAHNMYDPCKL